MFMLKSFYRWLTYSAYDLRGNLRVLTERTNDPSAFNHLSASEGDIRRALGIICESFFIKQNQQFCLRPEDNLADIYNAITKYQISDDMEYERLILALTECIGEFDMDDLTKDNNLTVQKVIELVSRRLAEKNTT
jgi:hypothetical protein